MIPVYHSLVQTRGQHPTGPGFGPHTLESTVNFPFISIFPGPIQFNEDYRYTIYYVRTTLFNHVIFTAMKAFSEVRYSVGFIHDKKHGKIMLVSPDVTLNETTENESHILDSGMLTDEQAERFNILTSEFSEGLFKTKQGMDIFYGTDSKKRNYSLIGNNCTSMLSGIFPNMMDKLGTCRKVVNSLSRGGKKIKSRKRSAFKFKTFRNLPK